MSSTTTTGPVDIEGKPVATAPPSKRTRSYPAIAAIAATFVILIAAIIMVAVVISTDNKQCSHETHLNIELPRTVPEIDVFIDLDSHSHQLNQPIPGHSLSEAIQTEVGQNISLNVIGTGGPLKEPTLVEEATFKVTSRNVLSLGGDGRRLETVSTDVGAFNFTDLLLPDETGLAIFKITGSEQFAIANITGASCVVDAQGTLSLCEVHKSDEFDVTEVVQRRRQLLIVVGSAFTASVIVEVAVEAVLEAAVTSFVLWVFNCFPGDAIVQTPRGSKLMKDLKMNDQVLTHDGWSPIYLFGHYDPKATSPMIHLSMASGDTLSLSGDHYIPFVNGSYASAKNLQAGDIMWVHDANLGRLVESAIVKVGIRIEKGLFNPFPYAGTLVVNNVLASAHSGWMLEGVMPEMHIPAIYNAMMGPVRGLHTLFPNWLTRFSDQVAGTGALHEKGVLGIMHAAALTAFNTSLGSVV